MSCLVKVFKKRKQLDKKNAKPVNLSNRTKALQNNEMTQDIASFTKQGTSFCSWIQDSIITKLSPIRG